MSRQEIALPWRDTGEEWRLLHLTHLIQHYGKDFDIILADPLGDFNRSAARNSGVDQTQSDVAVIIDADNFIALDQIHKAIEIARNDDVMVKPFQTFGYLTEEATLRYYLDEVPVFDNNPGIFQSPTSDNFSGGAYVCKKTVWSKIGGADENFKGWGGEDDAIHLSCSFYGVPIVYVPGYDYHLYHPANRQVSKENLDLLFGKYVNRVETDEIYIPD